MKNYQVACFNILLLSILTILSCQSQSSNKVEVLKETIYEKHYQIQVKPESLPAKLSKESEYHYSNGQLNEKREKAYASYKPLETKEVFEYANGKLNRKLTYINNRETFSYEGLTTYNSSGDWTEFHKKDDNGRTVLILKQISKKDGKLEIDGTEQRGTLKISVDRTNGDSIVHLSQNHKGKLITSRTEYKLNKVGNVVLVHGYSHEDSLVSEKEFNYTPKNSKRWTSREGKISFLNYDGKRYVYRDSVVRTIVERTEKEMSADLLMGAWYHEDSKENYIVFQAKNKFVLFENKGMAGSGTWEIDPAKKTISLNIDMGDDRGKNMVWECTSLTETMFEINARGKTIRFKKKE